MKKLMGLVLAVAAMFGVGARAQDVTGQWQGTLKGTPPMRIVLKITKDEGQLKVVAYNIDGGAQPMNASNVVLQGTDFKFSVPSENGSYEGKLSADGNTINGAWTQDKPVSLILVRASKETAWDIPERPKPLPPMAADADPSFEVATIKPSDPAAQGEGFRVRGRNFATLNTPLLDLMTFAYGVQAKQILNLPDWAAKEKYDISAVPDVEGRPSDKQWRRMLQKLLADRFKFAFHHDTKELPVYALTVAKDGPKNLAENTSGGELPSMFFDRAPGGVMLPAKNGLMTDFTGLLQEVVLDRPVVDQTGLKGRYDFNLKWAPDDSQFGGHMHPPSDEADALPGLFAAVGEQLGLKLETTKAKVDVMVVERVEKPSAN